MVESHCSHCQFSVSWVGGQLQQEVARGHEGANACVSLSSRSFTWRSPCRRAVGVWWDVRWTAGCRRGHLGHSALTHAVPAVSPRVPPCPLPLLPVWHCWDSQPQAGSHRPGAGMQSSGITLSHTESFRDNFGHCRGPEVLDFFNKADCFQSTLKWETQFRKPGGQTPGGLFY